MDIDRKKNGHAIFRSTVWINKMVVRWYAPGSSGISKYERAGTSLIQQSKSAFLVVWVFEFWNIHGLHRLGWVGSKVNLIENDRGLDKIDAIEILCFSLMIFAITCHVPNAESSKAFGSLSSDIARKPFDRAMRKLSYLKYARDTYQSIRIVCPVCQNMPNTFNFASFDTLISNLTESFILPKRRIFHLYI